MSETAHGSLETQNAKNRHLGTIAQLCQAISSQLRQVSTTLLNIDTSSTCPHNMVNFGLLTADPLASLVHPCKFQRVSRLGSVIPRHSSSRRQQTLWRWTEDRGRHLYSAGRPSRWALAHIL